MSTSRVYVSESLRWIAGGLSLSHRHVLSSLLPQLLSDAEDWRVLWNTQRRLLEIKKICYMMLPLLQKVIQDLIFPTWVLFINMDVWDSVFIFCLTAFCTDIVPLKSKTTCFWIYFLKNPCDLDRLRIFGYLTFKCRSSWNVTLSGIGHPPF